MMNAPKKHYFKSLKNNKERPTSFDVGLSVVEIEFVFQLILSRTAIFQFSPEKIDVKINFVPPQSEEDFAVNKDVWLQ